MFQKIQKHFKKPKGLIGRIVGKIMAFDNKTLNTWTLRHLKWQPGHHVLEIGYGPGEAIHTLMGHHPDIKVDGIDISETMEHEAKNRVEEDIKAGRVQLYTGDIAEINLKPASYERVFTVNNYLLWEQRQKGLRNVRSAMTPNGRVVITMQPRQKNEARSFAKEISHDLAACGFQRIRVHYKNIPPEAAVCVTAVNSLS